MPRLVRKDDPSIAIIGVRDLIPAIALITGATSLDDLEYADESEVDWDNQRHDLRSGQRVFIDEHQAEVLEDNVMLVPDQDED